MKKDVVVQGYCPFHEANHSITAWIQKINFAGDGTDYAKCVGVVCDSSNQCNFADECLLLKKAQNINRW